MTENAGVKNAAPSKSQGWHQMAGVENAGVENVAPSLEAYSGFQVRWREVRGSGGRKSPSEVQEQNPSRESGGRTQEPQAFLRMKA